MFEARDLDYAYSDDRLVVHGVNLVAEPRSMTAVIGANGSGKSTLIRMLAGLLRPRAGTITLDDVPLNDWEPRLRARQ
ncbi:MAG: iron dicitrate transporter ATP-binding protein, partial [Bryobacterales bacterium]|nr:iron dicitrate transporter ATP-binding protein [Bryobacterales bacterium]